MAYKKIKSYKFTEKYFRNIWNKEYCEQSIFTFDNIEVKFYSHMFNHCFYESANKRERDKSILSYNRLEKIYWIKDTLQDSTSIRKQGWNRDTKTYSSSRRVNLVRGNYIVVIIIYADRKARFVTAYEINDDENLKRIIDSPDWA